MIYFFHHYELPAILQQARIQQLLVQSHQQQQQQQNNGEQQQQQQQNTPEGTPDAAASQADGAGVAAVDGQQVAPPASDDNTSSSTPSDQHMENGEVLNNSQPSNVTATASQNNVNASALGEGSSSGVAKVEPSRAQYDKVQPDAKTVHQTSNDISDLSNTEVRTLGLTDRQSAAANNVSPNQPNLDNGTSPELGLRYRNMSTHKSGSTNTCCDSEEPVAQASSSVASSMTDPTSNKGIGARDKVQDCDPQHGAPS